MCLCDTRIDFELFNVNYVNETFRNLFGEKPFYFFMTGCEHIHDATAILMTSRIWAVNATVYIIQEMFSLTLIAGEFCSLRWPQIVKR